MQNNARPTHGGTWAVLAVAVIGLVLLGGGGGWYYFYGPCGTAPVRRAVEDLRLLIREWDDVAQVANSTSRIGLAGPVADLQSVVRRVEAVSVPICLEDARMNMAAGMRAMVDGFLAFMTDADDATIAEHFESGALDLIGGTDEIQRIVGCAPFCVSREAVEATVLAALPPTATASITPTPSNTPTPAPTVDPCPREDTRKFILSAADAFDQFDAAENDLDSASLSSLNYTLGAMTELRKEAALAQPPRCGTEVKAALIQMLDTAIDILNDKIARYPSPMPATAALNRDIRDFEEELQDLKNNYSFPTETPETSS